jgi:head-tail adaptor
MNAGKLSYFLTPLQLENVINPETGEMRQVWVEGKEMRAERVKFVARAAVRGSESVIGADAVYYVRIQHPIDDGWRVRERGGVLYDVVVEPNREKGLKLLKCTKVND